MALSARVVRAAPDDWQAHQMRAIVLSGMDGAWEECSAAELREAATHFERAAALHTARLSPLADNASVCRLQAEVMAVVEGAAASFR
jgi:hypothetical protein